MHIVVTDSGGNVVLDVTTQYQAQVTGYSNQGVNTLMLVYVDTSGVHINYYPTNFRVNFSS